MATHFVYAIPFPNLLFPLIFLFPGQISLALEAFFMERVVTNLTVSRRALDEEVRELACDVSRAVVTVDCSDLIPKITVTAFPRIIVHRNAKSYVFLLLLISLVLEVTI
jgi:hypothetical protein